MDIKHLPKALAAAFMLSLVTVGLIEAGRYEWPHWLSEAIKFVVMFSLLFVCFLAGIISCPAWDRRRP